MKKKKGFTLIELLVVIAIIAMLLAILMPALGKVKRLAMRLVCGTNLKGMANALNVYAFDYRDEYPIAGGAGTNAWMTTAGGADAYWNVPGYDWSIDNTMTVSASLFMLVREADVGVKSFVCTASDQKEFVNTTPHDIVELWDFGASNVVKEHCSYSYQIPYGAAHGYAYAADGTTNPANAVMADRNPVNDSKLTWVDRGSIDPDNWIDNVSRISIAAGAQKYQIEIGNAEPHDREAQNVLFNDGHVEATKRPDVGTRYDNIYTQNAGNNDEGRRVGNEKRGLGTAVAINSEDSLLVNDDECK